MIEKDPIKWSYKVMWYGRRQENYKFHAENLQEELDDAKTSENKQLKEIKV